MSGEWYVDVAVLSAIHAFKLMRQNLTRLTNKIIEVRALDIQIT